MIRRQLIELVDAAYASVGEHQSASLEMVSTAANVSIATHGCCESRGCGAIPTYIHTAWRRLLHGLQHLTLPETRVAHYEHVNVATYLDTALHTGILLDAANHREKHPRFDHLVAEDARAQRVYQLPQLVSIVLLRKLRNELEHVK